MTEQPRTRKHAPARRAPRHQPRLRRTLRGLARSVTLIIISVGALFAVLCALIVLQGQRDEAQPAGAAIVLGAAQNSGDPAPVLRARLDHAIDLYRGGTVERIILTDLAHDTSAAQAAMGREYLLAHSVPSNTLILEDQGTTTLESLHNTAALARSNGISSVLVVSDPFHMLRALKMARDLHLNAYGSPTHTPVVPNRLEETRDVLREAWAYLVYVFARR